MAKYRHVDSGEVVAAEQLTEDQGIVDADNPRGTFWLKDYHEDRGDQVEFVAGTWVLKYADGTIKTCADVDSAGRPVFGQVWEQAK